MKVPENALFIFVGHRKRNGKDTVCNFIKQHYGDKTEKILTHSGSCIQYARKIVDELFPNFEKHEDAKDDPHPEYNNISYREAVIGVVKSLLALDELCLAKHFIGTSMSLAGFLKDKFNIFLVPDCRRDIEFDYFKNVLGDQAIMVEVDNPRVENVESFGEGSLDNYDWDISIKNDGDLQKLQNLVDQKVINIIDLKVQKFEKASSKKVAQ